MPAPLEHQRSLAPASRLNGPVTTKLCRMATVFTEGAFCQKSDPTTLESSRISAPRLAMADRRIVKSAGVRSRGSNIKSPKGLVLRAWPKCTASWSLGRIGTPGCGSCLSRPAERACQGDRRAPGPERSSPTQQIDGLAAVRRPVLDRGVYKNTFASPATRTLGTDDANHQRQGKDRNGSTCEKGDGESCSLREGAHGPRQTGSVARKVSCVGRAMPSPQTASVPDMAAMQAWCKRNVRNAMHASASAANERQPPRR
jgi:hypothetical protein